MKKFLLGILGSLLVTGAIKGEDAVRELLLIPPEEIAAVDCSDDEFFASYATSIRSDMEYYVATMSETLHEEEAAQLRETAEQLIRTARAAYDASLLHLSKSTQQEGTEQAARNMLRSNLLTELHLLHATGSPWCNGLDVDYTPPKLPPGDQRLLDEMGGCTSTDIFLAEQLLTYHTQQLRERRRLLRQITESFYDTTASFDAAEQAWERYFSAICRAHFPVVNHHTGGTGTPTQVMLGCVHLALSQQQRLTELVSLYKNPGADTYLTDFADRKGSDKEKRELYAKARGIEKLLRTPVELRYPEENKQAWTDEDFFAHYANALHEEMDAFIDEELRSAIYLEDYGKEQSDKDAAACKRCVDEMVSCARAAYLASLEWYTEEAKLYREWEAPDKSELISGFRIELQNRLLADITTMLQNQGNRWLHSTGCSIAAEMPDRGATATEFENALTLRHWDTFSKRTVDAWLHPNNEETLAQYRQFMVRFVYNEEHKRPTEPANQGFSLN